MSSAWCDDVSLIDEQTQPYLHNQKVFGLATYQDTLFLLALDKAKRLVLIKVSQDEA